MREHEYTVVSDFSANGSTRGSLFPVMDMDGGVLATRKPDDPLTDLTELDLTLSESQKRASLRATNRTCLSCGEDISRRHRGAKRCVSCARKHVVERARQWNIEHPSRARTNKRSWRARQRLAEATHD